MHAVYRIIKCQHIETNVSSGRRVLSWAIMKGSVHTMFLAFAAMILLLDSRATAQDDNDIDVRNDHTLLNLPTSNNQFKLASFQCCECYGACSGANEIIQGWIQYTHKNPHGNHHINPQEKHHDFPAFLSHWIENVLAVQSRPLVRSAFCPKKFDHTRGHKSPGDSATGSKFVWGFTHIDCSHRVWWSWETRL